MSDKVYIAYHAPEGDSKVCEMGGKTFLDGVPVECDSETDAELIATASANKHFEVSEVPPPKHKPHDDKPERESHPKHKE